jgi:hypothetical protein
MSKKKWQWEVCWTSDSSPHEWFYDDRLDVAVKRVIKAGENVAADLGADAFGIGELRDAISVFSKVEKSVKK